jgi:predicted hydrocarbon binding protein
MGEQILLIFDSLTSPYLMNQDEILRFIRTVLLRLSAEGNAVLACMDEGCGREKDLVAMMSTADGILKMEMGDKSKIISVVKHPELEPVKIKVPIEPEKILETRTFAPWFGDFIRARIRGEEAFVRGEVGDFVNLFWPNFARWSGILWDPKNFPVMMYELNKNDFCSIFKLAKEDDVVKKAFMSWRERIMIRLLLPNKFQTVKDIKKVFGNQASVLRSDRCGILEYLEDKSGIDEHFFRVREGFDCWGFENVGGVMSCYAPSLTAGFFKALEYYKGVERDWNAIETKCIGLGDPHCEFKLVPGELPELRGSLEKNSEVLDRMHDRLMDRLMGHLLEGTPIVNRPALGPDVYLGVVWQIMGIAHAAAEKYRIALRMGGARSGKEVGERLMRAGLSEERALDSIVKLLEHCKVGRVSVGETIRMTGSCESLWTKGYRMEWDEPLCLFTTGFLNGFYSAVYNQHVREVRCAGLGDPYCEWEFG